MNAGQGQRQLQTLLGAIGQAQRRRLGKLLQANAGEQLLGHVALRQVQHIPGRQPVFRLQDKLHILEHGEGLESLRHLKSARHTPRQPLRRRQLVDALASPQHFTGQQTLLPGNTRKTGGLAGPVGTDQGHALAHPQLKTHAPHRLDAVKVLDQVLDLQLHASRHFLIKPSRPDGDTTMMTITNNPRAPRQ